MHPTFASDPGFVDRFEREARAAARLNSPYAVAVHDQGNDAGVTYLVMEYVPGHTVRDVLRTHGALPPAQALAIIDPVLQALAAAHRAGYIHRDVKPENVLISEDGRVKVTDFGLARAIEGADSGKTHGLLLGTVAYLSPEQVEHDHTDARSDVYSAGILLFELVTGQVPFTASAPMQVAYRHVHEDVPPPSSIRPGIPVGIDELVLRATRRNPDQRFGDADAFLSAARVQKAQLPPAQPWAPSPTDTLVVNREAGAGAAAAVAAGAAVAAAGSSSQLDAPDWVNQRPAAPARSPEPPVAEPQPPAPAAAQIAAPDPDGRGADHRGQPPDRTGRPPPTSSRPQGALARGRGPGQRRRAARDRLRPPAARHRPRPPGQDPHGGGRDPGHLQSHPGRPGVRLQRGVRQGRHHGHRPRAGVLRPVRQHRPGGRQQGPRALRGPEAAQAHGQGGTRSPSARPTWSSASRARPTTTR